MIRDTVPSTTAPTSRSAILAPFHSPRGRFPHLGRLANGHYPTRSIQASSTPGGGKEGAPGQGPQRRQDRGREGGPGGADRPTGPWKGVVAGAATGQREGGRPGGADPGYLQKANVAAPGAIYARVVDSTVREG